MHQRKALLQSRKEAHDRYIAIKKAEAEIMKAKSEFVEKARKISMEENAKLLSNIKKTKNVE